MRGFFINFRDRTDLIEDREAIVLPSVETACREDLNATREILAASLCNGQIVNGQKFEITDETGEVPATFNLQDALKLAGVRNPGKRSPNY